jgi:hypothetical protein
MPKQDDYQGISKRTRLLLSGGEGKHVDYKEKVKGLHAEDLVAFANSPYGGAILIGVRESTPSNGKQKGEPIGHVIDDESKLQIMAKALSCSPPVQISITVENLRHLPFYRVEIPSGIHKPYSTSSGTYKIREDGRNNSLLPEQLLRMFLHRESEEFRVRFSEATANLESRMTEAVSLVESLEHAISSKIEEIGDSLGWAEYKAGDAVDTIEEVERDIVIVKKETNKQTQRLKALIRKLEAEDPVKLNAQQEVLEKLIEKFKEDPQSLDMARTGKPLTVSISGEHTQELDEADLKQLIIRALDKLDSERGAASKPM